MHTLMMIVHGVATFLLVLVVLLQSGKGAEISASFGGSSQTVFGSSGGANFFTRLTTVLATIFMATSIGLTIHARETRKSKFEGVQDPAPVAAPVSAPVSGDGQAAPKSAPNQAPVATGNSSGTAPKSKASSNGPSKGSQSTPTPKR